MGVLLDVPVERADELLAAGLAARASGAAVSVDARASDLQGKSVCFTGAFQCKVLGKVHSREEVESVASRAGLVVHSLSGKAKKARDYGVRILSEQAFWQALNHDIE